MITRIGDKIISITKVPDLRNYRGDRVLGLSCTSGRFGYIKLLSDLELPEFWDYISGRCDDSLCSIQKRKVMELLGLTKEILGSIITTPARASEFLLRHEISHILHHDSDDIRLSESGHLDPYRIGIEARATWEAWKQMKNKYMAKFRVQRMYADNDPNNPGQEKKKSGMGLGTKILAGTGAVAAGLTAAKFGAFGARAQIGVNKQLMNVGRKFESEALMNSGASGIAQGKMSIQKKALEKTVASSTATAKAKDRAQQTLATWGTDAGKEAQLGKLKQNALDTYGNTSVANARRAHIQGVNEILKANEGMTGRQAGKQFIEQNGTVKEVAAKADAAKAAAEAEAAAKKATEEAAKQQATTAATSTAPASYAMEAAFSDTDEDLREAVVIGTGLAALGSGALLMKNGKLGITKAQREATKKAYDKAVARVKRLYKEADRGGNKAQQEATNAAAGAGKKPFYSKEDKKAAEIYAKENGLSSWQEAAEKLGLKPESYK